MFLSTEIVFEMLLLEEQLRKSIPPPKQTKIPLIQQKPMRLQQSEEVFLLFSFNRKTSSLTGVSAKL